MKNPLHASSARGWFGRCALLVALSVTAELSCGSRTGLAVPSGAPTTCSDAARAIYVLTEAPPDQTRGMLLRFNPSDGTFVPVVQVSCLPPIGVPTALAVDRDVNLYIAGVSLDRQLLEVSIATGICQDTGFQPNLLDFGMTFSREPTGADALYVVEAGQLALVDTSNFQRTTIGPLGLPVVNPGASGPTTFLTGNGAGELFAAPAFSFLPPVRCKPGPTGAPPCTVQPGFAREGINEIDKATGLVITQWSVGAPAMPLVDAASSIQLQAFVFWGGDFYFFVSRGAGTDVWRFRRNENSAIEVGHSDQLILAAGASTCAPVN